MVVRPVPEINETTYEWCVQAFSFLHDRLGINVMVHGADGKLEDGQIFLFNHFTRFETVIPQYIIHKATGTFCRCVAASELFKENETFAKFLWDVGAVPTDHPGLLSFLAAEILRGRKVIVFPEGGMIKARHVLDEKGNFGIFSQIDRVQRKLHKGGAAIALTLEIFKKRILLVHEDGNLPRLQRWVDALGLKDVDALVAAARHRTLVVPGNITFYPIRGEDNILRKGAALFGGELRRAAQEELLIEGNILFKDTDMDIRFGRSIIPGIRWIWWERLVLERVFERIHSLQDLFSLNPKSDRRIDRMVSMMLRRQAQLLRDEYTREIYCNLTVNLSHLTSRLILTLLDRGITEIGHEPFHTLLYLSVKNAQREPSINLHRSLVNPERYDGIHKGVWKRFEQFLGMATSLGLIDVTIDQYRFLPKLWEEQAFHEVRLENTVSVYANEVAPVSGACRAVDQAVQSNSAAEKTNLARLLFDDEMRSFRLCRGNYSKPKHAHINDQETATENAEPYLFVPDNAEKTGVVLVHGFLASPAELRAYGESLAGFGYPVIGVRLRGHGTSPWDLRDRNWQEWLGSVRRGYEIISAFAERVCVIGFSTGGALSLRLAAEQPENLAGVATVSVPVKFRNTNLIFVPILHGINKLTQWLSSLEGLMPFRLNESEHPEINYRHIPVRGLFELRQLVDDMKQRLADVTCPVAIFQGTEDQIIDPKSANSILDKISSTDTSLHMIPSKRHGILSEDIGGTQELVTAFLMSLSSDEKDLVTTGKKVSGDLNGPGVGRVV
jgi:esterase/lipase/1-acyl-sn-glycerol-3-phosphate acyltransferase